MVLRCFGLTIRLKIAQKPCMIGSLGTNAFKYEAFEGKGKGPCVQIVHTLALKYR